MTYMLLLNCALKLVEEIILSNEVLSPVTLKCIQLSNISLWYIIISIVF